MFGDRLRDLRKELKLTQKQLGEKLSVSGRVIGYYETNERFPDKEILVALADYFNVSLDYLLCRIDKRDISEPIYENEYLKIMNDLNSLSEENKKYIMEFIEFFKQKENILKK